ncbi:MAG TPA: hypothetical protein PJ982_13495 [Lacipirellulaceae bacterium]|nr:hypothetical protein [Lacipirellulaceae bacterium]
MPRPLEVALIVDPSKPYDRRIIRGVAAFVRAQHRDWSLYVEEDPVARLPHLEAWGGDGVVANFDDRRIARAVSNANVPVVAIGGGYGYYNDNPRIPYVRTDNRAIAELAARHLLDLGHRRFAFCGEPPNRCNGRASGRKLLPGSCGRPDTIARSSRAATWRRVTGAVRNATCAAGWRRWRRRWG